MQVARFLGSQVRFRVERQRSPPSCDQRCAFQRVSPCQWGLPPRIQRASTAWNDVPRTIGQSPMTTAIHPAREHGSRQPNCYAVHGSPSRCAIFSEAFRSACRPQSHSEHQKWSPSRLPIEPQTEHRWLVWDASTFSAGIPARSALYVMNW